MPRIFDSFALVAAQAEAELTALFGDLADVLKDLREIFLHAKGLVSVEEFYDVYRPLLGAFWPDGIWLDGVGDGGRELVKWKGPSAGQSTMFVVFDLFLGIVHGQETASRHFQEEMLQYMPPKHVNFVQDFRANFAEDALTPRSYAFFPKSLALSGAVLGLNTVIFSTDSRRFAAFSCTSAFC